MTWINYDDVQRQLAEHNLIIDKPLDLDARIQRWKVAGEDNEKRGWSRLREWRSSAGNAYIVGVYGIWHGTDDGKCDIRMPARDKPSEHLTAADEKAMRDARLEASRRLQQTRKAEAKQAARWASIVWSACAPATAHEYLERKHIQPHGTRILGQVEAELTGIDESNFYRLKVAAGALVVPMHDEHGNVCGVQFIYPRGHDRAKKLERDKEFWPSGMAMGGTFGLIGHVKRDGIILVTEGFATAASLHESTGQTVAYAFSANNLTKTGKLIRKTNPAVRILFCADDDYLTEAKTGTNPGCTAAAQATAEIERSAWTKPEFTDENGVDRREGKKLSDYNDLAVMTGVPMVIAQQINAKLDALKWRDAASTPLPGRVNSDQGGGEGGRRRAQAVMALDDIVARFIPLDDGTGKYVFDTWTNKVASREQMIALLPAGVRGDDIKRHPVWIERGAYFLDEVGFDPSGHDDMVKLNTWRGWKMKPKAGSCERLLELLRYLCNTDPHADAIYTWILRWMAYPLQHPGAKMSSAVIMHGPQGTGKSTIFQSLAKIYGDYATVLNQRGLEDRFNADWTDSKLFILAEEVVTRAEMWHIKNELKELVTGEWIRINPKNIAAYRQRNQVNIVYLSNENQPLPIDNDDRRHLVVYTPPMMDQDFYDEVFAEIDKGGVEAFYHHLLHLDLGDFHPKKRPMMTEAKRELIDLSNPSEIRFCNELLQGDIKLPVCPMQSTDLYAAYQRWCKENGEIRPRPSNQFIGAVRRLVGWEKRRVQIYDDSSFSGDTRPRWLIFPPQRALEEAGNAIPPGYSVTRYHTEMADKFRTAMEKQKEARWAA